MPAGLPSGWTQHTANDGRTYYYNTQTKQSTYTHPNRSAGAGAGDNRRIRHWMNSQDTNLVTMDITSTQDANRFIGEPRYSGNVRTVPLVLRPAGGGALCCSAWPMALYIVPAGFNAVVTRNGAFAGVYPPGKFWASPCLSAIQYLVPKQFVVYTTPVKECPTQDNVMVTIDVAIVFHIRDDPEAVRAFVYTMGAEKLDKTIQAYQEEAVRNMVRKRSHNQIYDMMDTRQDLQLQDQIRTLNEKLGKYGITVDRITVTNVHLPQDIANDLETATTWDSKLKYDDLQQERDLKDVEYKEQEKKLEQKQKDDFDEQKENFLTDANKLRAKINTIRQETRKQVQEIKQTAAAEVLQIKSNSTHKVAQINAERRVILAEIDANAKAKCQEILMNAEVYAAKLKAETDCKVAQNDAQVTELVASAEKEAAKALKYYREDKLATEQIAVVAELGENPRATFAGDSGDNAVSQIVASRNGALALGLPAN